MSLHHGSKIVTDGLILCLDAANIKSYPGSGTTWKDISGNGNDGTLVNGVGYSSDNKGTMTFDGVDDSANATLPNSTFRNNFTVELFFYVSSQDNADGLIGQDSSTISPNSFWIYYPPFNNLGFRLIDSTQTQFGNFRGSVEIDRWYHAAMTVDYSGNMVSYRDSVPSAGVSLSGFVGQNNMNTNFFIGSLASNAQLLGGISNVRVYNRALTAQEISQNFQALRGRYGI